MGWRSMALWFFAAAAASGASAFVAPTGLHFTSIARAAATTKVFPCFVFLLSVRARRNIRLCVVDMVFSACSQPCAAPGWRCEGAAHRSRWQIPCPPQRYT